MSDSANRKNLLYIEDNEGSRNSHLESFKRYNIHNVVAPRDKEECQRVLQENVFFAAIIDYNLAKWLGENYEHPIILGEKELHNGWDIANYLNGSCSDIQIGMYTANERDLSFKVRGSNFPHTDVITYKGVSPKDYNKILPQYALKNFFNAEVCVSPLFDDKGGQLPLYTNNYVARRIIQPLNKGNHLWKVGPYIWEVDVLQSKSEQDPCYSSKRGDNQMFRLEIDPNTIETIGVYVGAEDLVVQKDKEALIELLQNREIHSTSAFIACEYICRLYIERQFTEREAIELLKKLPKFALYSQKYLFIHLQKDKYNYFRTKEDIQKQLLPFIEAGFPKVIEVFEGIVEQIEDNEAYVSLKSLSPGRAASSEIFDYVILQREGLEENAVFEYTVYQPEIGGGAYHLEPIQL